MDEKKSVVLYTEWAKPLSSLSLEDKGRIFDAILQYTETGEAPLFDRPELDMAFAFIRLRLDTDAQKWADVKEKRRSAGALGGKQRQANQANEQMLLLLSKTSKTKQIKQMLLLLSKTSKTKQIKLYM